MKRGEPLQRRTPLRPDPEKVREFQRRARTNSRPKRRPVSPASPAQRDAIHGRACIVTGGTQAITPAHLVDRSLGGCDHPLCVVPLTIAAHRAYDDHRLDLLPYLEALGLRDEIAHAVGHLGLIGALERLTGCRWRPVESVAA